MLANDCGDPFVKREQAIGGWPARVISYHTKCRASHLVAVACEHGKASCAQSRINSYYCFEAHRQGTRRFWQGRWKLPNPKVARLEPEARRLRGSPGPKRADRSGQIEANKKLPLLLRDARCRYRGRRRTQIGRG